LAKSQRRLYEMATTVVLHELTGSDYEVVFMHEVENFRDAGSGVAGDDVAAALICRDEGRLDLVGRLRRREIHVVGEVDEDTHFSDLEFSQANDVNRP
jgi:hypothetical protein